MNRNVFLFPIANTFFFLNPCHIGWCIRTGVGFGLRHTLSQSGLQRIPQKSSIIFRTAKQSIQNSRLFSSPSSGSKFPSYGVTETSGLGRVAG